MESGVMSSGAGRDAAAPDAGFRNAGAPDARRTAGEAAVSDTRRASCEAPQTTRPLRLACPRGRPPRFFSVFLPIPQLIEPLLNRRSRSRALFGRGGEAVGAHVLQLAHLAEHEHRRHANGKRVGSGHRHDDHRKLGQSERPMQMRHDQIKRNQEDDLARQLQNRGFHRLTAGLEVARSDDLEAHQRVQDGIDLQSLHGERLEAPVTPKRFTS